MCYWFWFNLPVCFAGDVLMIFFVEAVGLVLCLPFQQADLIFLYEYALLWLIWLEVFWVWCSTRPLTRLPNVPILFHIAKGSIMVGVLIFGSGRVLHFLGLNFNALVDPVHYFRQQVRGKENLECRQGAVKTHRKPWSWCRCGAGGTGRSLQTCLGRIGRFLRCSRLLLWCLQLFLVRFGLIQLIYGLRVVWARQPLCWSLWCALGRTFHRMSFLNY